MRLSTKSTYSLEALVLLAHLTKAQAMVSLHTLSSGTGISEGYLEQLFKRLKESNLVVSKKGKNGGYTFAKPLAKISVRQVLVAAEGSLSPVKCAENMDCAQQAVCFTKTLWADAYDIINQTFDAISLAQLVEDYEKRIREIA